MKKQSRENTTLFLFGTVSRGRGSLPIIRYANARLCSASPRVIERLETRLKALQEIDETVKKRRAEMKSSIEMLESTVEDGAISDTNLRMLVDTITIYEIENGLEISI